MLPSELISLLHLASPALPIGGFSYSQGFEAAVECGFVTGEASAARWIRAGLETVMARCELPFIAQQMLRWQRYTALTAGAKGNLDAGTDRVDRSDSRDARLHAVGIAITEANAWYLAGRESAELRQETEQMGWSLTSLSTSLAWGHPVSQALLTSLKPVALPTAFAFATVAAGAGVCTSVSAYAFNWVENQVAAALKAVPLGQLSGQRILWGLRESIAAVAAGAADVAAAAPEDVCPDIGAGLSTFAPLLGILSARHESQYSRLFRS